MEWNQHIPSLLQRCGCRIWVYFVTCFSTFCNKLCLHLGWGKKTDSLESRFLSSSIQFWNVKNWFSKCSSGLRVHMLQLFCHSSLNAVTIMFIMNNYLCKTEVKCILSTFYVVRQKRKKEKSERLTNIHCSINQVKPFLWWRIELCAQSVLPENPWPGSTARFF